MNDVAAGFSKFSENLIIGTLWGMAANPKVTREEFRKKIASLSPEARSEAFRRGLVILSVIKEDHWDQVREGVAKAFSAPENLDDRGFMRGTNGHRWRGSAGIPGICVRCGLLFSEWEGDRCEMAGD